jgi:glycosyltransferase involved in cell wall biosynthesis
MSGFAEFARRTELVARFKRALLIFWLPLVLAAAVPAIIVALATWFETAMSSFEMAPSPAILILSSFMTLIMAAWSVNKFVSSRSLLPTIDLTRQHAANFVHRAASSARPANDRPKVTILLCTLNGERFLAEQLASLERQTFKNWELIASDDGSWDRTKSILLAFQKSFEPGRVEIIDGPRRGASANFLFLSCAENLVSEYYAFCDQDDVWDAAKLERAIDALERTDPGIPALYGSRTRLVDEAGNEIGFSPLFHRKPGFRSALVQSIAGGNTMVFNQKARELVMFCGADVDVPSHDWWLYQVTSACDGQVHYDGYPSVRYRQHGHNVIGSNMGWTAFMHRLHMVRQGRFRHWEDLNVAALTRLRPRMSAENRRIFDLFRKARHEPLLRRATIFAQSGVYRRILLGNLRRATEFVLKGWSPDTLKHLASFLES